MMVMIEVARAMRIGFGERWREYSGDKRCDGENLGNRAHEMFSLSGSASISDVLINRNTIVRRF